MRGDIHAAGHQHRNAVPVTVAAKKPFLLRIDPQTLERLQKWADDDLRSLNSHIEYLLRKALLDSGRLKMDEKQSEGESGFVSNPPS